MKVFMYTINTGGFQALYEIICTGVKQLESFEENTIY